MTPLVMRTDSTGTGEWHPDEEGSSSSTGRDGIGKQVQQLGEFISVSTKEIEEESSSSSELFEIKGSGVPIASIREEEVVEVEGSLFSYEYDCIQNGDDVVYVAVLGKSSTEEYLSMDALVWTLNHAVNHPSSTIVYLIHVFPEIRHIPTPLGRLPISQANPEQKENYMIQERSRRREFLQKFLDLCSASKVKVETILIESDMEAKAILDLIPILNITKLVVGTTKSNLRKMKSRRGSGSGSGIADQIVQKAPELCEVKIISEGKEVVESPSPRGINDDSSGAKPTQEQDDEFNESFTMSMCNCFKPKAKAKLKVIS